VGRFWGVCYSNDMMMTFALIQGCTFATSTVADGDQV
jgi:hypothetical protein